MGSTHQCHVKAAGRPGATNAGVTQDPGERLFRQVSRRAHDQEVGAAAEDVGTGPRCGQGALAQDLDGEDRGDTQCYPQQRERVDAGRLPDVAPGGFQEPARHAVSRRPLCRCQVSSARRAISSLCVTTIRAMEASAARS